MPTVCVPRLICATLRQTSRLFYKFAIHWGKRTRPCDLPEPLYFDDIQTSLAVRRPCLTSYALTLGSWMTVSYPKDSRLWSLVPTFKPRRDLLGVTTNVDSQFCLVQWTVPAGYRLGESVGVSFLFVWLQCRNLVTFQIESCGVLQQEAEWEFAKQPWRLARRPQSWCERLKGLAPKLT